MLIQIHMQKEEYEAALKADIFGTMPKIEEDDEVKILNTPACKVEYWRKADIIVQEITVHKAVICEIAKQVTENIPLLRHLWNALKTAALILKTSAKLVEVTVQKVNRDGGRDEV